MNPQEGIDSTIWFIAFLLILIFLYNYAANPIIQEYVPKMLEENNITGIESMFWNNISLIFYLTILIIVLSYGIYVKEMNKARY